MQTRESVTDGHPNHYIPPPKQGYIKEKNTKDVMNTHKKIIQIITSEYLTILSKQDTMISCINTLRQKHKMMNNYEGSSKYQSCRGTTHLGFFYNYISEGALILYGSHGLRPNITK